MAELLLELFSEEIPARMQLRAAEDLKRLVTVGLSAAGLGHDSANAFATPRRLTLVVDGLAAKSSDVEEERKGPRVGAPAKALEGFLRGAGLATIEEAEIVSDAKKGDFYVARLQKPGRKTGEIVAEIVPAVIAQFPWPKSMRWGSGKLRWVRPLQSILCLFDGKVVKLDVDGVAAGATTQGHRFLAPGAFKVADFADYEKQLKSAKVILDPEARAKLIARQATEIASKAGLELVEDEALLHENAGLTEWPVVLMGSFDDAFLAVPPEVLTTSMKTHQKCFSLRDPKTGRLANKFLLVSNLKAGDGGKSIVNGNQRVIRARLSDAKFFWETDLKRQLEPMHFELKNITFHAKLGTQWERMERITELARRIAGAVDAEPDFAGRAAQLCKADLVSGMVGEFPELQGLMGRYLAEAEHMNPKIALAIEEHYKPRGAGDTVPVEPVSIALALADKFDTLVGFWAIDEKPTGSGDPYQLRRAALGVIRICLENDLRLRLVPTLLQAGRAYRAMIESQPLAHLDIDVTSGNVDLLSQWVDDLRASAAGRSNNRYVAALSNLVQNPGNLIEFFADRLKVHLREEGARHDLIDAVFALGDQEDLALIVHRVNALGNFLQTDDGANLLAGVKRAVNILRIEEKKDGASHDGAADPNLLAEPEEKALYAAIEKVSADTIAAINVESFRGAMSALAELRAPVDAFFEKVTVNTDDAKLRQNRLRLLAQIRAATRNVADFSRIEG